MGINNIRGEIARLEDNKKNRASLLREILNNISDEIISISNTGTTITNTSELINDGQDGSKPYLTEAFDIYSASTIYNQGDIVTHNGGIFRSNCPNNQGEEPIPIIQTNPWVSIATISEPQQLQFDTAYNKGDVLYHQVSINNNITTGLTNVLIIVNVNGLIIQSADSNDFDNDLNIGVNSGGLSVGGEINDSYTAHTIGVSNSFVVDSVNSDMFLIAKTSLYGLSYYQYFYPWDINSNYPESLFAGGPPDTSMFPSGMEITLNQMLYNNLVYHNNQLYYFKNIFLSGYVLNDSSDEPGVQITSCWEILSNYTPNAVGLQSVIEVGNTYRGDIFMGEGTLTSAFDVGVMSAGGYGSLLESGLSFMPGMPILSGSRLVTSTEEGSLTYMTGLSNPLNSKVGLNANSAALTLSGNTIDHQIKIEENIITLEVNYNTLPNLINRIMLTATGVMVDSGSVGVGDISGNGNGTNIQIADNSGVIYAQSDYFLVDGDTTFNKSVKIGDYTLPLNDGLANQVIETNGFGVLSWVTPSGGGSGALEVYSESGTLAGGDGIGRIGDISNRAVGTGLLYLQDGEYGSGDGAVLVRANDIILRKKNGEGIDINTNGVTIAVINNEYLRLSNYFNKEAFISIANLTNTPRTYNLPDKSGTIALLPTAKGTAGQFLQTDGDDNVVWATPSGGSGTGLEAIDEGNGIGWRLIGRNPANYGIIGLNSIDFSFYPTPSERGATGNFSFIGSGHGHIVTSDYSFIGSGYENIVAGVGSFVGGGENNEALGDYSVSIGGSSNIAQSYGEWVGGLYSTNYTASSTTIYFGTDRLFNIGNGTGSVRSDAFTILKNAQVGIDIDNFEANTTGEKFQVNGAGKFSGTLKIGEYTLPSTDGTSGQQLQTNGSGVVTWATPSGTTGATINKYTQTFGDGINVNYTITHGLNTEDISITVKNMVTKAIEIPEMIVTDMNNINLNFNTAPNLNEFRVTIIG